MILPRKDKLHPGPSAEGSGSGRSRELPLAAAGPGGSTGGVLQGPTEDEPSESPHPATDDPWRYALKLIEAALGRGEKALDLASLPCSTRLNLDGGPVVELVATLLRH